MSKITRQIIFCFLDVIWDLFESHRGSSMDFQKSGGTTGVPQNSLAVMAQKSVLISTYLAPLGSSTSENPLLTPCGSKKCPK